MVGPSSAGPIDVLHVASFVGNIGDNANHNGMRRQLQQTFERELRYEESEMRRYYQNYTKPDRLAFDEQFVQMANTKDLVIIGGGSFFDLWLSNSATGTTIDLTTAQIDRIETPLVFNGLGCIPGTDISGEIIDRFRTFLDHLFESDHCLVSVRNDGSERHIRTHVGDYYADQIATIPDGGFFVEVDSREHPEIPTERPVIGINLVSDMADRRFPGGEEYLDYAAYIEEFRRFTDQLLSESDAHLVFLPHIYSDFEAISDLLSEMDVMFRRNRITVAPYLHGMGSERYFFSIYDDVDLTMGLRFHSNVCPLGLETPSIGLSSGHPKVGDLYTELGFEDRVVSVNEPGFAASLRDLVSDSLTNRETIQEQYHHSVTRLEKRLTAFHQEIVTLVETVA